MKAVKLLILSLAVFMLIGCSITVEEKKVNEKDDFKATGNAVLKNDDSKKGFCVLTLTDEERGRFLMIDELFSKDIRCDSNFDCYDYLLSSEEYRGIAPEFEEHLSCERYSDNTVLKY